MASKLKQMRKRVKQAKAARTKQTWTVSVIDDCFREQVREPNEGEGAYCDRGDTSTSHSIEGICLVKEGEYRHNCKETVLVGFEPKYGVPYHLLYAVYNGGDSFGHDDGQYIEAIGLYKSRHVAEENLKILQSGVSKDGLFLLKEEGVIKPYGYHAPWGGWCNGLNYIQVECVMLE